MCQPNQGGGEGCCLRKPPKNMVLIKMWKEYQQLNPDSLWKRTFKLELKIFSYTKYNNTLFLTV